MERLTKREYGGIVSKREEQTGIICSSFCDNCSQGAGNCKDVKAMVNKLADYEDLEEQGLLLKLPCAIGSDVYFIPSKVNFNLNKLNRHKENNRVYNQKVAKFVFTGRGWYLECDKNLEYGTDNILVDKFYKETWFLSQGEAEEALKRMEGKE